MSLSLRIGFCGVILVAQVPSSWAREPQPKAAHHSRMVAFGDAQIEVHVRGTGPTVVLMPSLGRSARDFNDLARRLAAAGFQAVMPEPRGIGKSRGDMKNLTMSDLADDIAAVIRNVSEEPVVVLGHAFGNRVARMTAADHPELVRAVVLVAAGGKVPMPADVRRALSNCFDASLNDQEHLAAVRMAFFAKGSDPAVWRDGWYPVTAAMQRGANAATSVADWWTAGRAPLLVVQGSEDVIAPRRNGLLLKEELGERVQLVDIPDAGHALLPEQPRAIAEAVIEYLRAFENRN